MWEVAEVARLIAWREELMAPFVAPKPAAPAAAGTVRLHRIEAPLAHPGEAPWWHDMHQMVDGCQQGDQ